MTFKEKLEKEYPECIDSTAIGGCIGCPDDYGYREPIDYQECRYSDCGDCWNCEIPENTEGFEKVYVKYTDPSEPVRIEYWSKKSDPSDKPTIKDSGERRQFETGAVRDIQEGKGRCDLMPLDIVAEYIQPITFDESEKVFFDINTFIHTGEILNLYACIDNFTRHRKWDTCTMFLEVSKHFEEGAKKYGENNWQKGIPTHCYIDSAVRHYLKYLRCDKDEPHDRAFVWNIMCCIWTCIHKPELNEYGKEKEND